MATLSHFLPHFLSLSSHNSQTTTASFSFFNHHSCFHSNRGFSNGQFSVVCLASTKKSRPSRKLMGDAELCNALREFMISVGLPEGHVPSTKELSQHGRKDLANIVRRRGHKLIQELLYNSVEVATDGSDSLRSLNGDSNENSNHGETGRELADIPSVNNDPATRSSLVAKHESTLVSKDEIPVSNDPPISLQEKVENFMKYGQLDAVEDDLWGDFKLNDGKVRLNHEQNPVEGEPVNSEEHIRQLAHGSDNNFGQNGTKQLIHLIAPTVEDKHKRNMNSSAQGPENTDFDNNMHIEAGNMVNKVEINHLKHLLHLKELELSRLKEDIEKEKQALSALQEKAENEIYKAKKLISEKDAELSAAEDSLSGLVEAKIQYYGEGQIVEVAGSFNGWHQRINLDAHPTSAIEPGGSRKSRIWSTTLWLYPGVYEIKFIVDGHWKVDPQRESTIKGGIENNIIRVDR